MVPHVRQRPPSFWLIIHHQEKTAQHDVALFFCHVLDLVILPDNMLFSLCITRIFLLKRGEA
jgi:hypothetical protein